jgi:hypothetical protein
VLVGIEVGVFVGALVGVLVGTFVGVAVEPGLRVRVGGGRVRVGGRVAVLVSVMVGTGEGVTVSVGGDTYCVITTTVRAAIVLILETAESTMFCGWMSATSGTRGSVSAAAATRQNRLNPSMPAPSTVKGPRYALIFVILCSLRIIRRCLSL